MLTFCLYFFDLIMFFALLKVEKLFGGLNSHKDDHNKQRSNKYPRIIIISLMIPFGLISISNNNLNQKYNF